MLENMGGIDDFIEQIWMTKMLWETDKYKLSNLYYRNKISKEPPKPKEVADLDSFIDKICQNFKEHIHHFNAT